MRIEIYPPPRPGYQYIGFSIRPLYVVQKQLVLSIFGAFTYSKATGEAPGPVSAYFNHPMVHFEHDLCISKAAGRLIS
jgi:hypothetical protein